MSSNGAAHVETGAQHEVTVRHNTGRVSLHSPDSYASIASFISGIGTFGGGITFAVLFSLDCQGDDHIPKLLGFASVLFSGAVLACVPIFVALHTIQGVNLDAEGVDTNIDSKDKDKVTDPPLTMIRIQAGIVALLVCGAFICMFIAILLIGNGAPAILGFTLIVLNVIWSLLAYFNIPRDPPAVKFLQIVYVLVVALVAIIFGISGITGIKYTNHCQPAGSSPLGL